MQNKNLLIMLISLFFGDFLFADVKVTSGAKTLYVINKSTMPVLVAMRRRGDGNKTDQGSETQVIQPGAAGTIFFKNKDTLKTGYVKFFKEDGKTLLDPVPMEFDITKVPTQIFVYGDKTLGIGLTTTPSGVEGDANYKPSVPSRFVAWWYGEPIEGASAKDQPQQIYSFGPDLKTVIIS